MLKEMLMTVCMETQLSVTVWQELSFQHESFQFSAAVAITTFEIYGAENLQVT